MWHVNALLSNEVQVDVVSKGSPVHSPWNEWEREMCLTSPNAIAVTQELHPAASEAATVRTFLLQSSSLLQLWQQLSVMLSANYHVHRMVS